MENFLKDKNNEQHNHYLKPLSRSVNLNNTEYEEYLNQAMQPDQAEIIRNIAIAGKYGSGKSSVIDSYFSKYYQNDYLRVSFATFRGKKQAETDNSKLDENGIYLNIINQVIYQVKPSKIPITGFKVKKPLSKKRKISLIITGILILSWLFKYPNISSMWYENIRNIVTIALLIWVVWIVLSSISLANLVMKFKGISMDIKLGNDDFFEKYGDEIVYLFRQSGKRILIIEDLDRFKDIRIFEKLRELNTKLNANGRTKWQFIFLIKDDIFLDSNDRVKFFDLMIPIVPFMTAANSYEKIQEMFKRERVDDELLFTLSLFITDYRLLTNIFNEFTVFKKSTKTTDFNGLLSMVAYKNLYPAEFDGVQNGQGKLADIFNEYQMLVDDKKSKVIAKKQQLIEDRESTAANNVAEAFFLYVSRKKLQTNPSLVTPEDAKSFIAKDQELVVNNRWRTYSDFLEVDSDYKKYNNTIQKFETQIKQLNDEIKRIENSDITSYVPDELETEHDKMVYTLIRQGYIRRNYLDVINRFYGEENSRQFLQNALVGQGKLNMDMKFDSINTWWKKLKPSVFETAQIQNFSVLKYAKENDIEKYKIIIKSAEMYDTTFLEKALRNSEDEDLSHQYFEDFIKYAPKYLFHVEDLNDKIISKILQKRRYATDSENIELLTEHFIGNMNVEVRIKFINDSNQNLNLRLGVLRKAIDQIDLEEINDEALWDEALNFGIMNATIANLNHYYEKKGFSKELQDFILVNKFNDDGDKLANELFSEMLVSNAISDEIMVQFISVLEIKDEFLWKNIKSGSNFKKLLLLIESDLITLTPDVFETIRDNNELLPDILITQNVVDFLVEQNIKPLPGWITQFIDSKLLNIKKFLKTFIMLLNKQQYQKTIYLLSNQSEKFEKILTHSRGYANQKIAMVDDNELLLKWLEGNSFIKSFSDDNRGNYVLK